MNTTRVERAMISIGMALMEVAGLFLLICGILDVHPF